MDGSKIKISFEDLIYGMYSILTTQGIFEISYEKILEYENEVIKYLENRHVEIFVDSGLEQMKKFMENHPEVTYKCDRMILPRHILFIGSNTNNILKYWALNNQNVVNVLLEQDIKKLTLSK